MTAENATDNYSVLRFFELELPEKVVKARSLQLSMPQVVRNKALISGLPFCQLLTEYELIFEWQSLAGLLRGKRWKSSCAAVGHPKWKLLGTYAHTGTFGKPSAHRSFAAKSLYITVYIVYSILNK